MKCSKGRGRCRGRDGIETVIDFQSHQTNIGLMAKQSEKLAGKQSLPPRQLYAPTETALDHHGPHDRGFVGLKPTVTIVAHLVAAPPEKIEKAKAALVSARNKPARTKPKKKLASSSGVEQDTVNVLAAGSIPASPAKPKRGRQKTSARLWEAAGVSKAKWFRDKKKDAPK